MLALQALIKELQAYMQVTRREKYFNTVIKGFSNISEEYLKAFQAESGDFPKPADYQHQLSKFDK
ncbi:hypothetical protein [Hellea balneolensis]|uniref:hypothetical protein n=1 Tax=Hellea balneolensis TaxID=287478 RepID=UPI00047CC412|nr:hypothetical protein [Hellea balneolensis]